MIRSVWIGLATLLGMTYAQACESGQTFAAINAADATRIAGNPAAARTQLASILAASPTNARARYVEGLILIDLARNDPAKIRAGLAVLTATAEKLPDYSALSATEKACAEGPRLYTIFNSIGSTYLGLGDKANAEKYLLRGKTNAAAVEQKSKAKIYNNLGLLYLNQMKLSESESSYKQAKAVGSATADARINAIQQIRGLAAH